MEQLEITEQQKPLDFGDYCTVEQKRFGVDNEHYQYKVIGRLRSNAWVNVPLMAAESKPVIHDESADILLCICCGVCEEHVDRFREIDCKPTKRFFN